MFLNPLIIPTVHCLADLKVHDKLEANFVRKQQILIVQPNDPFTCGLTGTGTIAENCGSVKMEIGGCP